MERLRRAAPTAPPTLAGIVLPQAAVIKGEPARGPLPRTEPSLRDRYAALDNHHPGQWAALYRMKGEDRQATPTHAAAAHDTESRAMGDDTTERDRAPHQRCRVVVWGCDIHSTPAGQNCQGCADQGELFSPTDVPRQIRRRR